MSEIEFIKRKGGQILLLEGHQYYKHSVFKNGSVKWRCSGWKNNKCPGTVTVEECRVIKKNDHKCEVDYMRNEKDKTVANLRDKAKQSDEPIPKLYEDTLKNLSDRGMDEIAVNFPELSSIKHSLYSDRNKEAGVSKMQNNNLVEIEVPIKFKDFILADYLHEGQRIIIFCTAESRKLIGSIKEYFGDATFQCCPKPFAQLYILLGDLGSTATQTHVEPLIFALMADKKEHTYYVMFEMIKSQLPQWNPSKIHCDFELSAINGILRSFPGITVVGCYYHWGKCLWRNAKKVGCDKTKQERRIVSLCAALPLLPKDLLLEGWKYISSESVIEIFGMKKFMDYIKKTWLRPKYITMISVFAERHRTNNVAEGFNSKINKAVHKNTVNIMRLLNTLHGMCIVKEINISKKSKRCPKYIQADDVIRDILLQLINQDISLGHALEKLR